MGGLPQKQARRPPDSRPRFRLKRGVELFPASDGALYLLRAGGDEYVLGCEAGRDRRIVETLAAGYVTPDQVEMNLVQRGYDASNVAGSLLQLEQLGLAERQMPPLLTGAQAERYDRQLIYLADLAPPGTSAEQLQQRLISARVALLGCGGLGSWTACALACAGVGSLLLVDDDRVELSNLNRQLLFNENDLGEAKVEVAAGALRRHNSQLNVDMVGQRVRGPKDVTDLLPEVDLLIVTADWPPHALPRWVNEACLEAAVPYITAGQFPPRVRIGPLVLPGRSACLQCLEEQTRRRYPLYDELADHRMRSPTPAATVGAVSGVVGSMLAMEAIHLLVGVEQPASVDNALIVDLRTMTVDHEPVAADPDCRLCSGPTRAHN